MDHNFDIMEHIGADVMYRRNSAKVISSLNQLVAVAERAKQEAIDEEMGYWGERLKDPSMFGPRQKAIIMKGKRYQIIQSCEQWYRDQWIDWLGEAHYEKDERVVHHFTTPITQ